MLLADRAVHPPYIVLYPHWSHCLPYPQALDGEYVLPGPGGDPIRNPGVLPTGKNIHALDPQSIPTQAAIKSARIVVERCGA